jgi:hypothetical protein
MAQVSISICLFSFYSQFTSHYLPFISSFFLSCFYNKILSFPTLLDTSHSSKTQKEKYKTGCIVNVISCSLSQLMRLNKQGVIIKLVILLTTLSPTEKTGSRRINQTQKIISKRLGKYLKCSYSLQQLYL